MGDNILDLPANEYHIPTQDEINIINLLFKPPNIPFKMFIHNAVYITLVITFLNLLYFKYLHKIPYQLFIIISIPLLICLIYFLQTFNYHSPSSSASSQLYPSNSPQPHHPHQPPPHPHPHPPHPY